MLYDEVRMPAQLFEALRHPDVLVVHIGHVCILFGIATNSVPEGELQLSHGLASEIVDAWLWLYMDLPHGEVIRCF